MGSTFEPYLKTGYVSNGWTNWEDAFHKVKVGERWGHEGGSRGVHD